MEPLRLRTSEPRRPPFGDAPVRDFSRISRAFWIGRTGKALRDCGPTVQLTAHSGRPGNNPGSP